MTDKPERPLPMTSAADRARWHAWIAEHPEDEAEEAPAKPTPTPKSAAKPREAGE